MHTSISTTINTKPTMLTIPFLKTATTFYLICCFVAVKAVAQHTRRQQDVNADFDFPGPASGYDIDITSSNDPGWTVNAIFESFFQAAQEKWPTVITGDLSDIDTGVDAGTDTSAGGGAFGTCPYPKSVDDLWICASANNLGGFVNNRIVLAYANFLDLRGGTNGLPWSGRIAFNNEALGQFDNGIFKAVAIHEIGHVLGIGTLWDDFGLATSDDVPCKYDTDSKASDEYQAISGCSDAVPLEESTGRPGSDCSHWEERCLVNEIMTPSIDESDDPISRVTVGTLEDLGYEVDYKNADSYNGFSAACSCTRDPASTGETTTTKMNPDETRHDKRSLQDPDHPDAHAIAQAKEIVAAMIEEGPSTALPWVNIVTYDIITKKAHSYIINTGDL